MPALRFDYSQTFHHEIVDGVAVITDNSSTTINITPENVKQILPNRKHLENQNYKLSPSMRKITLLALALIGILETSAAIEENFTQPVCPNSPWF